MHESVESLHEASDTSENNLVNAGVSSGALHAHGEASDLRKVCTGPRWVAQHGHRSRAADLWLRDSDGSPEQ